MFDKFPHLKYLLSDERLTQHSGTKIKLKDVPKTGDSFSIAGGLELGSKYSQVALEPSVITTAIFTPGAAWAARRHSRMPTSPAS